MMAKLESKVERMVPLSRIAPTTASEYVCSTCLRPYLGKEQVEYICEDCGAAHYFNQFYICCPADAERPL
jgi:hypothetical protein